MNLDVRALASRAWRGIALNRQFAIAVAVLVLAFLAFPGAPGRSLLDDVASASSPRPAAPVSPPTSIDRDTLTSVVSDLALSAPGASIPAGPTTTAGTDAGGPPATPPPAPDDEPAPACTTDAAVDVYDQVQAPLAAALDKPLPSRSVRDLAAIAAGCSDADPTGAVLNLVLDVAELVPDLGLPPVPLPDVPSVPLPPVPPEVLDALAPIAGPIRDGCSNLAIVALLLGILPAAVHLPVRGSDLAQLIAPATSVCAVFDEGAPS